MICRNRFSFIWLCVAFSSLVLVSQISAQTVDVSIHTLTDTNDNCFKYVKDQTYLKITHSRVLYVNPDTKQIVGNAFCSYKQYTKAACTLLGSGDGDIYFFVSVTLNYSQISVDVDYRYNEEFMGLSKIEDPRTLINKGNNHRNKHLTKGRAGQDSPTLEFQATNLLQIKDVKLNDVAYTTGSCHDDMPKILIADHGLYITKIDPTKKKNIRWENIYFEPYKLGEYIFEQ